MRQHQARSRQDRKGLLRALLRLVLRSRNVALLAVVLSGCRTPAGSLPGGEPNPPSRPVALARIVVGDSLVESATRPIQTSSALAADAADFTWSATAGLIGKRLILPHLPPPAPIAESRDTLDAFALDRTLLQASGRELQPVQMTLHTECTESLAALETLIDGATQQIDVLMFLWEGDDLGMRIARRLAARAQQGIRVRVLVDGGANLIFGKPATATTADVNRAVCWLATQPNIEVLRTRIGFARFDHRKLVLADGRRAWSGGRNFNHSAFFYYHDATFVVVGPIVDELQATYDTSWIDNGGITSCPSRPRKGLSEPEEVIEANAFVRLVGTGPHRHDFRDTILTALDRAKHHIYVHNPYLGDPRILLRLARARRRGVDVRVIMTLDATTPLFAEANRVTVNRLLQAGVRVYLRPGMTHVKALSVDGVWAYLGTGNFDALSMRSDHEVGFAIGGGTFVREIEDRLQLPEFQTEREVIHPLSVKWSDYLAEFIVSGWL